MVCAENDEKTETSGEFASHFRLLVHGFAAGPQTPTKPSATHAILLSIKETDVLN